MINDVMEYWVTLTFATGSIQEFHVTGLLNALTRAKEIIEACENVTLLECNIKVIQWQKNGISKSSV